MLQLNFEHQRTISPDLDFILFTGYFPIVPEDPWQDVNTNILVLKVDEFIAFATIQTMKTMAPKCYFISHFFLHLFLLFV